MDPLRKAGNEPGLLRRGLRRGYLLGGSDLKILNLVGDLCRELLGGRVGP
jgi:hypothetical protein